MIKRIGLYIVISFVLTFTVTAGDIANFENLGFSENSKYFMFGQYGIIQGESVSYARLYVVDVSKNIFVPQGVRNFSMKEEIQPGQTGKGSFYHLFGDSVNLVDTYDINHLKIGRLVYLLVDGEFPKSHIEFRDFNTGNKFVVDLYQSSHKDGKTIAASFHIIVKVIFNNGKEKSFTVGLPDFRREGVLTYRIRQIILSPDEKSIVFVVEKESPQSEGKSIRYMVETVKIMQ